MANINVLSGLYNHYLTTYAPKKLRSNKADTDRDSELRKVYNSMIKLNKEAPLSIVNNSEEAVSFAVDMKENAREFKNTISSLSGIGEDELLSRKIAYSSNEDVAEAKFKGSSDGEEARDLTLTVDNLATPQINTTKDMPSKAQINLFPGTYSFDVSIGQSSYEFQFNIAEGDTNEELQNKLARLFNNSNIGLKCEVVKNEEEGTSHLTINSVQTGAPTEAGKELLFTIDDALTSKTKGAVNYLGLDNITTMPDNARYTINGRELSSYSNEFTQDGYEIKLHNTTDNGPITIGLKANVDSIGENIDTFVRSYNSFVASIAKYDNGTAKTNLLLSEFNTIARSYSSDLNSLGLSLTDNGRISMDKNKFSEEIEYIISDQMDTLNNLQRFTGNMLNKADNVSLNPMDYVNQKIVAYKNPGKGEISPYAASQYSGMMFNGYC